MSKIGQGSVGELRKSLRFEGGGSNEEHIVQGHNVDALLERNEETATARGVTALHNVSNVSHFPLFCISLISFHHLRYSFIEFRLQYY